MPHLDFPSVSPRVEEQVGDLAMRHSVRIEGQSYVYAECFARLFGFTSAGRFVTSLIFNVPLIVSRAFPKTPMVSAWG